MRSNAWLREQLENLLQEQFSDMPRPNHISIEFGRQARRRLGSIRMSRDKKRSHILINGHLRADEVPEQIICSVIAHELCHYAHGFCSPLPQKYKNPHSGGIIPRELKKRGLHLLFEYEKEWTKNHWPRIVGASRAGYLLPRARGLLSRFLR